MLLDSSDIEQALLSLAAELSVQKSSASVHIVGGAAIALTVNADRLATSDVDAKLAPKVDVRQAAARVSARLGLRKDWLNDDALAYFSNTARETDWTLWRQVDDFSIWIAKPAYLLAMKLNSNRPGRDGDDLKDLLDVIRPGSREELDELFEGFYPGECITQEMEPFVREWFRVNGEVN